MFCFLEKDEKTYRYLQMVIATIREERVESLVKLDNVLQTHEIKNHLYLNRLPETYHREEMINWIHLHGRGFRDYLNTIKVAALMWSWAEETRELSWGDFWGYWWTGWTRRRPAWTRYTDDARSESPVVETSATIPKRG